MQDIRIDDEGNFRCWKCGGKNFDSKRTFAAKAAIGVGALLTHKKLKCQTCGEYNDTGNAKPFVPAGGEAVWQFGGFQWRCIAHGKAICNPCRRLAVPPSKGKKGQTWPLGSLVTEPVKNEEVAEDAPAAATPPLGDSVQTEQEASSTPVPPANAPSVADELKKLADLRDAGVLTEEEFANQKAILLGHDRRTPETDAT